MLRLRNGIYCIEGFWPSQNPSYSAIKPTLKAIHESAGLRVIHRHPVTLMQFKKYVTEWTRPKFYSYSVLCQSFHGGSGEIFVGAESVTLEEISTIIAGRGNGRMIYFSSCATLATSKKRIIEFMTNCNLARVAGYEHYISIGDAQAADEETLFRMLSQNLSKKTAQNE